MNLFYSPAATQGLFQLDETESNHAVKVLRLKLRDQVLVLDGKGHKVQAEITTINKKVCELHSIEISEISPRPFSLHIAIAPTKMNERMEWFLEKATEIGVESITPVVCSRSERKTINPERFHKVIVAACKQSIQPWFPVLNPLISFREFIDNEQPGFIAHCNDSTRTALKEAGIEKQKSITILVGPEGDFTPGEVQQAVDKNWIPVSLGENRLRTETAGLVACHTVTLLKS